MSRFVWILLTASFLSFDAQAAVRRVVIVKADGVPGALVQELVSQQDPVSGKSVLPWIDEVFCRQGVRVENFYVRGISLSTPSWAMLDTGLHQSIHGNAEFDRFTLRVYDYLNFVPFFLDSAFSRRVDMPGVEVLDQAGVPLMIDRFAPDEIFQSFQLFQRGNRWSTLKQALPYHLKLRGPWRVLEDSQTGLEIGSSISEKTEQQLIQSLHDPKIRYLDFFTGDYDHVAHLSNDRAVQVRALKSLDALIGRLWTAIQATPEAKETMLVLVSDHGMNTEPVTFSQGFSLVDWFGSAAGGGHHVMTNRYPLSEYKLHGLNPLISSVVTPSASSTFLKGEAQQYPTVALDPDGNERAAVQLRNNDLGLLHFYIRQKKTQEFFELLDRHRVAWQHTIDELKEEVAALSREIGRQDKKSKRVAVRIRTWKQEERSYGEYIQVMERLLSARRGSKVDADAMIPKRSFGEANSLYDLQHYGQGVDYFAALKNISVKNVPQAQVGPHPVDFIAASPGDGVIWLYAGPDCQALITERDGRIRYLPVANLRAEPDGSTHFDQPAWAAGFPLHLWEDPHLNTNGKSREEWLKDWHTEQEWKDAIYSTEYSLAVIGLLEQFRIPEARIPEWDKDLPATEIKLLLRLENRRRRLVIPDLVVLAANHWNFNIRGFNPGGNHGSFFQPSAHATFMLAGGTETGIPKGVGIKEPYDSLSFLPTLLNLMNIQPKDGDPVLPGPVIPLR